MTRRRFLAATGASALAVAAELTLPRIPFETDPYDIRDSTLWRFYRGPFGGIMGLCGADDKDSNHWQWKKTEIPKFIHSAHLKGNFDTFVRDSTLADIRMSCDGIREVYHLKPPPEVTWRLIFQTIHQTDTQAYEPYESAGNLFTGKIKGGIKFMRGNGDILIYAMDEQSRRVPLTVSGPYRREDPEIDGRLI